MNLVLILPLQPPPSGFESLYSLPPSCKSGYSCNLPMSLCCKQCQEVPFSVRAPPICFPLLSFSCLSFRHSNFRRRKRPRYLSLRPSSRPIYSPFLTHVTFLYDIYSFFIHYLILHKHLLLLTCTVLSFPSRVQIIKNKNIRLPQCRILTPIP